MRVRVCVCVCVRLWKFVLTVFCSLLCNGLCAPLGRNKNKRVHNHYYYNYGIVQELCESRGGHPGLSVLASLLVSVDIKLY